MSERVDQKTGEIIPEQLPATVDTTMASAIVKAELDSRVTTAHAFPRSVATSVQNILSLVTLNEKTAETMIYAVPRGNKPIVGPSIRLAEIVSQCWGNCVSESRMVAIDRVNKIVTAEGLFTDLQTNSTVKASVERRISDKHGRLYSDDMIAVTGNAARSIARRNAILAGVPKAIWEQAYEAAEQCVAGDVATVAVTREKAIKAFAVYGLKPEQVYKLIDVKGEQDIGIDEVLSLRAMYASIKNGEATVEELMAEATRGATNFERVANPLKDAPGDKKPEPRKKAAAATATTESTSSAGAEHAAGGGAPAPTSGAASGAGATSDAKKTEPKTQAAYVAYAGNWRDATDDADDLARRWDAEKTLRNKCLVEPEVRDDLKALLDVKVGMLRAKAGAPA
jgi:hypothetical protein